MEAGFIPVFVELLNNCDDNLRGSAIRALSELANSHKPARQQIADAGAIPNVAKIFQDCENHTGHRFADKWICLWASNALLNHLAKTKDGKQKIKIAKAQLAK